jgi:hypothetical protein
MAVEEKIIVDVETKEKGTEDTAEKFSKLQTRIRETRIELQKAAEAGDQALFSKLRGDLDDLEDQLAATTIRSQSLTDTLSQIPGPIGDIAAQAGGALDQLKAFSNLTLSDLKLSVAEFGKDLKGALVTLGNLTGITKVYTVLNNALAASFVRVGAGEAAAAAGARAFAAALTATGVGALIVGIGLLINYLTDLYNAYSKAGEKIAEENARIIAENDKLQSNLFKSQSQVNQFRINELKKAGASEKEILEARKQGIRDLRALQEQELKNLPLARRVEIENAKLKIKEEEELQKKLNDIDSEYKQKERDLKAEITDLTIQLDNLITENIVSNREKLEADQKKRNEQDKQQRVKDLADITKAQRDAFLVTLEEQEREEYAVNEKYTILISQAVSYNQDTTLLEEARLIELDNIRKKYADKELKDNEAKANEILKRLEEFNKEEYDKELNALETRYALGLMLESQYQDALFDIKAKYAETDKELRDAELEGLKFFMSQVKDYGKQYEVINAKIVQSYVSLGENIATVFGRTAQLFEQGSTAAKVFGVLSVVANAASGIAQVIIKNQETQAAYNNTIDEGTAAIASGTIKLTNPLTAPLGVAELAAGTAAIGTAKAGKIASRLNAGIQIGTIGATSAAQIAAILSAKKSDASVKTSGAGAGGSGGTTITGPAIGAPQVGAGAFAQQGTIAGIVAGAIQGGQSGGRPIRAYVVGNEITSQQQLERRIRAAARLGG